MREKWSGVTPIAISTVSLTKETHVNVKFLNSRGNLTARHVSLTISQGHMAYSE